MTHDMSNPSLFGRDQFRMSRLQVYDWGTFSGIHDIPIARRGFLFVGRSGAGKSTLLDALSALLVPPQWTDFNAAAREADRSGRDRNLATYIRGAWAEQKDGESGEIATRFLRTGTTWSALALTYHNDSGRVVTLVQLFWLLGNNRGATDVQRCFLIFEKQVDLRIFEGFGQPKFDLRKLKQDFPDAYIVREFSAYKERFCSLLGIESDRALRLLHKTQSAKSLGDLNTFLRDFMLDKPPTFEAAAQMVSEFGELNAAHQAVVDARRQVQVLVPAREQHERRVVWQSQGARLEELRDGMPGYREMRRMELLREQVSECEVKAEGLAGEVTRQQGVFEHHSAGLRDLEQRHREMGGDQIERWEAEVRSLEGQRQGRQRKRDQVEAACRELDWALPKTPAQLATLLGSARQELEQWEQGHDLVREKQFQLAGRKKEAETDFVQVKNEVEELQRQPSNIPAGMLGLRREIAKALSVSEAALPFVGELIEVKPEEGAWQGAVERVLHGFALSLLVDEEHYAALASHVNAMDLGQRRLVYLRTLRHDGASGRPVASNSLVFKLAVKEGTWREWVQAELRHRFDYACVESMQAFRNTERAITKEGQIKQNRSRHEKDDRHRLDDRRHWVLGFNNHEKRALYERQAQELALEITRLGRELDGLKEEEKRRHRRSGQCQALVNVQWDEMDPASLVGRIDALIRQISETREGDADLRKVAEQIEAQKKQVADADQSLRDAKVRHEGVQNRMAEYRGRMTECGREIERLAQDPSVLPLRPSQKDELDVRVAAKVEDLHLGNLDRADREVTAELNAEIAKVTQAVVSCERVMEGCFQEFKRTWPAEAGDMDTGMASASDYFAKLARLEADGLPTYEHRFFELLKNQSHQNLAALASRLNAARKDILERMGLVNESLREVPFNQSENQRTYLRIEPSDRQLPQVREFKQEIQQALSHALTEDREQAEARFAVLQRIVARLGSEEAEQRRWRDTVLDVRQHMEFVGRELDEGDNEIEVYRSGAGKSGGQRQKLATTCLAAALRYQLGGHERGVPVYAPVVLDEAFDKADNEFTALAMQIFTNFGFQMIVATPMKSVMTIEPFIGGACFVSISDRQISSNLLIEYDDAHQRLKLPMQAYAEASDENA